MTLINNKRIAKNTLFLYIRMLITMVVALYTSRVVLITLGVTDYGIYNVVGGIVTMLGFIANTMASASQRFLAFEIGKNDFVQLKKTFSITFTIYLIFTIVTVVLGETIGLWFVCNKLTIPADRMNASIWVYQFSILAFIVTILRTPYNAVIIAHEKMGFYAWNSIFEVILKLFVVFMLLWFKFDKLILFSVLTFVVISIVTLIYLIYCQFYFKETKYQFYFEKKLFQSMFSFAGWNIFGGLALVGMNQGVNILLNMFFSPAINAARGLAFQISGQISAFVGNFQIAASPQIIKYYALDEKLEMKKLYYQSSKLSYFLLFIISLPVFIEMNLLLQWWLKYIPEYTSVFARLVLINGLIDCMSGTSLSVVQATSKMKYYQIFLGTVIILNLPISYFLLKNGFQPEITMIVMISISIIALFIRLFIVRSLLGFKIKDYLIQVVANNLLITLLASIFPLLIYSYLKQGIYSFCVIVFISVLTTIISIYYVGLNNNERTKILILIRQKIAFLK